MLGVVAGLVLCRWGALSFETTIRVGELVNAAIALVIFVLANQIYSKLSDTHRRENDLLFSLVEDILAELGGVEKAFLNCWGKGPVDEQSARALLSAIRRYGNSILTLEDSVRLCKKDAVMPKIEAIKSERFKYKNLLTGGYFPTCRYDASVWPRRETMHGDNLRALRELQFDLNRA